MNKIFKYLISITILLALSLSEGISFAFQTDSRGFPITQSPGPSFGTPSLNNSSPLGAPLISLPPISNQPIQHVHPRFFYFDYNGYPYYGIPTDNSFYYSTTDAETSSDYQSVQSDEMPSLPQGRWVHASNGEIPDKAFVYQTDNGTPTYYCRTFFRSRMVYGVLAPHAGCLIQDSSGTLRLNQYEVLVSFY